MYEIYGDYGYTGETLLKEFESLHEATRWVDGYTEDGDLGGYARIEVVTFAESGEIIVHYEVNAEDFEDEWDGQPDEAQEWADFDSEA